MRSKTAAVMVVAELKPIKHKQNYNIFYLESESGFSGENVDGLVRRYAGCCDESGT